MKDLALSGLKQYLSEEKGTRQRSYSEKPEERLRNRFLITSQ